MSRYRRYLLILPLIVALAVLAGFAAARSNGAPKAAGASAQIVFKIDHYTCYAVKGQQPFDARSVRLKDQFGKKGANVLRPAMLCVPVVKNEGEILHKEAKLLCYLVKAKPLVRKVRVVNQFKKRDLQTVRPRFLCLPTGVGSPSEQPLIPKRFDHYLLYAVKAGPQPPKEVTLADEFGTMTLQHGVSSEPVLLGNPVSKNAGKVVNKRDHLVCYPINPDIDFNAVDVAIVNQFESGSKYTVVQPKLLCLPSLKKTLKKVTAAGTG